MDLRGAGPRDARRHRLDARTLRVVAAVDAAAWWHLAGAADSRDPDAIPWLEPAVDGQRAARRTYALSRIPVEGAAGRDHTGLGLLWRHRDAAIRDGGRRRRRVRAFPGIAGGAGGSRPAGGDGGLRLERTDRSGTHGRGTVRRRFDVVRRRRLRRSLPHHRSPQRVSRAAGCLFQIVVDLRPRRPASRTGKGALVLRIAALVADAAQAGEGKRGRDVNRRVWFILRGPVRARSSAG